MSCYIEQTLASIEHFDRTIPWMYLDAEGRVTVGAGMVLPDLAAARRLPFQVGSRAATQDEIAADFARVEALAMGRPALFYRQPGGPQLELAVIDTLLRTVLVGLEEHLREHLADYDHLPPPAKMALLDMTHCLTPARLFTEYTPLLGAVRAGAWAKAATQSFRHGQGAARNQWTAAMFRAAAPPHSREGPLKRLGYGLIGLTATLAGRIWNQP